MASVIRVRDYEEALNVANATPSGLSAGIVTTTLNAGLDYHVPFGGRKKSSYGPRGSARRFQ